MLKLNAFTINDLAHFSGVKASTVRTIVGRYRHWLVELANDVGVDRRAGGQVKRYVVRPDRRDELAAAVANAQSGLATMFAPGGVSEPQLPPRSLANALNVVESTVERLLSGEIASFPPDDRLASVFGALEDIERETQRWQDDDAQTEAVDSFRARVSEASARLAAYAGNLNVTRGEHFFVAAPSSEPHAQDVCIAGDSSHVRRRSDGRIAEIVAILEALILTSDSAGITSPAKNARHRRRAIGTRIAKLTLGEYCHRFVNSQDEISVDSSERVAVAISRMLKQHVTSLPVLSGAKVIGAVDTRLTLRAICEPELRTRPVRDFVSTTGGWNVIRSDAPMQGMLEDMRDRPTRDTLVQDVGRGTIIARLNVDDVVQTLGRACFPS